MREGGDEVVGETVAEKVLLRVGAHVEEREHGDGGDAPLFLRRPGFPGRLPPLEEKDNESRDDDDNADDGGDNPAEGPLFPPLRQLIGGVGCSHVGGHGCSSFIEVDSRSLSPLTPLTFSLRWKEGKA